LEFVSIEITDTVNLNMAGAAEDYQIIG